MNNQIDENHTTIEQQPDTQLNEQFSTTAIESGATNQQPEKKVDDKISDKDFKILSVGDWMITILVYIIPVVNLIMMAIWAFSSKGNIHRKNLSRALLLWWIILLIAYVVAMTVAGFTIMDIFL